MLSCNRIKLVENGIFGTIIRVRYTNYGFGIRYVYYACIAKSVTFCVKCPDCPKNCKFLTARGS